MENRNDLVVDADTMPVSRQAERLAALEMIDGLGHPGGHSQIIETTIWDKPPLDLYSPIFIEINASGQEAMALRGLEAPLDRGFTSNGADFAWNGADKGDPVSGHGWTGLRDDGCRNGEITYHKDDETTSSTAKWAHFALAYYDMMLRGTTTRILPDYAR